MGSNDSTMSERKRVRALRRACSVALSVWLALACGQRAEAQEVAPARIEPDDQTAAAAGSTGAADQMGSANAAAEKPWNQGVSLAKRREASALFDAGYELLTVPLFSQAAEKFEAALALYEHPAIYFNLALAQFNLVQPVQSYENFGKAMAYGEGPIGTLAYGRAREYRRRLSQQLGHLEIRCDTPGARVTLDGRPLFVGPGRYEGKVTPGEHQLLASKSGFIAATERVVLSGGERARVPLILALPEVTTTVRRWPAWRPWAVTAVGAAIVAVGGVIDWQAENAFADLNAAVTARCGSPSGCTSAEFPAGLRGDREAAETLDARAHRVYLVGVPVLVAGAVLLYLNREQTVRRRADAAVNLRPALSPEMAGVAVDWRF